MILFFNLRDLHMTENQEYRVFYEIESGGKLSLFTKP